MNYWYTFTDGGKLIEGLPAIHSLAGVMAGFSRRLTTAEIAEIEADPSKLFVKADIEIDRGHPLASSVVGCETFHRGS